MFGYIDKTAFFSLDKGKISKGVLSTHFDYELAEGIIDYANSLEGNADLIDLIYEIFPEITREEIEKNSLYEQKDFFKYEKNTFYNAYFRCIVSAVVYDG